MKKQQASFIQSIFSQHQLGLKRFITAKFGNESDAEELTQEAFQKFMTVESPEKLENPKAYLYQTAHNLALNRIRKQGRQNKYELDLKVQMNANEALTPPSPEAIISGRQDLELVLATLQQLPEKVRRAFLLSRAEGLSYREISELMGISVSSVEKYLMTALKHLRKKIPLREP
jgi:RNA polymerase sigma-70 factor (ECF subfamily)